ncbi:putative oxidoreductase [Dioscorea sansibarensis]
MVKSGRNVVFAINGARFELSDVDPSTTLLEFLRTATRLKGAQLGCGEGACVVLLSTYDLSCGRVNQFSVSSCLTLLCGITLCSVMTIEGLGNSKDGFHSIQERFAADKTKRLEPPNGFSKITVAEAEKAIAGLNSFWDKRDKDLNVNMLPFYNRSQNGLGTFPDFLKYQIGSSMHNYSGLLSENRSNSSIPAANASNTIENVSLAQWRWYHPSSIDELRKLMVSDQLNGAGIVKLVADETGSGYYKEEDIFEKYTDIRGIPELSVFLESPACDSSTLLLSVHIPFCSPFVNSFSGINGITNSKSTKECNLVFETYSASPRPLGNALPYLDSAFIAHISMDEVSGNHLMEIVQLVFGAYGCEHAARAKEVEKFFVSKTVTVSVLPEAIRLLKETVVPNDDTPHSAYRSSLAVGLLLRFLQPIAQGLAEPPRNVPTVLCNTDEIAEDPNNSIRKSIV